MNRIYRYPPALRVLSLFGAILAGGILLGSVIAEIEAADPLDFVLHLLGALVGAAMVWLGLEFGMRWIAVTPDGIVTRLVRERRIAWSDMRVVRNGWLGTLVIMLHHGSPIVIWPYLQDFAALLDALSEPHTRGAR